MAMLGLSDQIRALNEAQLDAGRVRVAATFLPVPPPPQTLILALTIGLGLLLAAASMRRILGWRIRRPRTWVRSCGRGRDLQALSARLGEAQEEERRSISRELHDEVGQALTGVLVEMANLSTLIREGKLEAMAEKAAGIKHEVENSIGGGAQHGAAAASFDLDDLGLIRGTRMAGARGFQAQRLAS